MEQYDEMRKHLTRLAVELVKREFAARLSDGGKYSCVRVANPEAPTLNERVFCGQAADGSWCFWWPWRQPIGSVDDLETVVGRITAVLRSVEGQAYWP